MHQQAKAEATLFLTMDGMRGVGAVMVVIGHCLIFWGGLPIRLQLMPYLVDMFFVLSGVVIAYAFEPRLRRGMTIGGFMLQRVVRLYPIYTVGIAMGLVVHSIAWLDDNAEPGRIALEVVPQLFMLPSLNTNEISIFTLNGPAWSLFFELCANLLYVAIFRFLSLRVLVGVVIAFAAALTVSSYYYGDMHAGWSQHHIWGGFPRAGFGFFVGVLIFRLMGSPTGAPRKISRWMLLILLAPISLSTFAAPEQYKIPAQLLCAFVYGPLIVWAASLYQPPRFIQKLCARAGALSYGIYMLHFPMWAIFERLAWKHPELAKTTGPWIGIGLLVASIALAWVVDRYYDTPVRAWLGRKLKQLAPNRKAAMQHAVAQ